MKDTQYIKWFDQVNKILKDCPSSAFIPSPPDERDFVFRATTTDIPSKKIDQGKEPECG